MSECTCPSCRSVIGYNNDDLYMGIGGLGIDCPSCGDFILTRELKQGTWPDAFWHFSTDVRAVHIDDNHVQQFIDLAVERLRKTDQEYIITGSGDTLVIATWDELGIVIYVCQGYYEAYIDTEGENA